MTTSLASPAANIPATIDQLQAHLQQLETTAEVTQLERLVSTLVGHGKRERLEVARQNEIVSLLLDTRRKGGLLLNEVERSEGGRPARNSYRGKTSFQVALDEARLSRSAAHQWMVLAKLPEAEFVRWRHQVIASGKELTGTAAYTFAKEWDIEDRRQLELTEDAAPHDVFPKGYVDPLAPDDRAEAVAASTTEVPAPYDAVVAETAVVILRFDSEKARARFRGMCTALGEIFGKNEVTPIVLAAVSYVYDQKFRSDK